MRSMQHEINNDFELMKEEVKKTSKRLEKKKPFCSMPVSSRKKKKGKKEKGKKGKLRKGVRTKSQQCTQTEISKHTFALHSQCFSPPLD